MTLDWHVPTVFPEWITEGSALRMGVAAAMASARGVGVVNDAVGSFGESGRYRVFENSIAVDVCPELDHLYYEAKSFVESMFGIELLESPYERSRLNVKIYAGEGSGQGLHLDSQPITVLLCLSSGRPLELIDDDGVTEVELEPGDLFVFCGKQTPHRVPPGEFGDFRVTVPMNFYFDGDTDRPEWLDAAIYDNQPSPTVSSDA